MVIFSSRKIRLDKLRELAYTSHKITEQPTEPRDRNLAMVKRSGGEGRLKNWRARASVARAFPAAASRVSVFLPGSRSARAAAVFILAVTFGRLHQPKRTAITRSPPSGSFTGLSSTRGSREISRYGPSLQTRRRREHGRSRGWKNSDLATAVRAKWDLDEDSVTPEQIYEWRTFEHKAGRPHDRLPDHPRPHRPLHRPRASSSLGRKVKYDVHPDRSAVRGSEADPDPRQPARGDGRRGPGPAARLQHVPRSTRAAEGTIPGKKVGNLWCFERENVLGWLRNDKSKGGRKS
jgi:hypothetical protein